MLFFELNLLPLVEKVVPGLKSVKHFVLMTDPAHMPKSSVIPNLLCYETLVQESSPNYQWPTVDENSACSRMQNGLGDLGLLWDLPFSR